MVAWYIDTPHPQQTHLLTIWRRFQHDQAMNLIQLHLTRTTTTTAIGGSCGGCGWSS